MRCQANRKEANLAVGWLAGGGQGALFRRGAGHWQNDYQHGACGDRDDWRTLAGWHTIHCLECVIWSGEDDPSDTLIPRLALSGADLSRVYFIADIRDGNERLLIVDPIVSAIAGDSHKNAEVRRGLQPLADLAASMRCALLGVTHFSKGTGGRDPVERLTGSLAFRALHE